MSVTSTFKWLVTLFLLFLPLVADGYLSYAAQIDERRIKNHSYHFSSLNSTVTLVDGKYSDPNLAEVRLLSYTVRPPSLQRYETLPDVAIIFEIVREGKKYHEILGLVSTENQLLQTNSIIIETILQSNLPVKAVSDMYMYMSTGDRDIRPRRLTSCVNVILRLDSGVESLCFLLSKSKDPPSYILRYEVPKIVKKPALYLYPLTETMVSVKLRPLGHLTETIPDYRNEWKVRVSAEGLIERRYRYLFYEVSLWYPVEAPDEGWCVKYENLKAWLTKKLPSLGLKDWEVRDFVDYWLKNLKRVEYYIIKPLSQEWINTNLSVEIDPKPDTFIRVILLFIPSNKPVNLKEPIISPLKRKGFTAVEWGGIVGANSSYVSEDGPADSTYSRADIYDTRKIGLIPLRGVTIQRDSIRIRVSSGGCTDTKHVRASVKVNTLDRTKIPVCEIGFYRTMPDNCKANFPDGVFLEYDMVHDLGIKGPCMVRILNPVLVEGVVKSAQSETKTAADYKITLKKALIEATIKAIQMELDQERKSLKAIRDEKIQFLKRELNRLENIKPEDYILEGHGERETFDFTYGPLIPPEERTVEALINRDLAIGSLLSVPTMRKSGPFYRVAGIFRSNFDSMELAVRKVKIYLVYKRDYFGFIPSYYVFVERILDE